MRASVLICILASLFVTASVAYNIVLDRPTNIRSRAGLGVNVWCIYTYSCPLPGQAPVAADVVYVGKSTNCQCRVGQQHTTALKNWVYLAAMFRFNLPGVPGGGDSFLSRVQVQGKCQANDHENPRKNLELADRSLIFFILRTAVFFD